MPWLSSSRIRRCLVQSGGMSAGHRSPRGDACRGARGVAPDPQSHHGEFPHRALAADPPDPPVGGWGARLPTAFRLVTTRKPSGNSTRQEFNRRLHTRMGHASPFRSGNRARQNQVNRTMGRTSTAISCGPVTPLVNLRQFQYRSCLITRHHVNQMSTTREGRARAGLGLEPICRKEALWV